MMYIIHFMSYRIRGGIKFINYTLIHIYLDKVLNLKYHLFNV